MEADAFTVAMQLLVIACLPGIADLPMEHYEQQHASYPHTCRTAYMVNGTHHHDAVGTWWSAAAVLLALATGERST